LRHGRLKILPHLQSLPRFSFLPLHDLAQILPARRRPHPAHQQRLADLLLGLLVRQGAFDQPARGGESLYGVVGLDAVAVRASGLQLQLLEERQVLVDGLARLSGGGKVLVVGEQQLALVLVDRLSYLLSSTLWALGQLASVELCKVTSKSTAFQLLLLLLALEQLLLIEVTLLQLAGETFPDDLLHQVRLPKLRLTRLGSLQQVSLSNILLQIQVVHCVQLLL
jgi:hypothetical protein